MATSHAAVWLIVIYLTNTLLSDVEVSLMFLCSKLL